MIKEAIKKKKEKVSTGIKRSKIQLLEKESQIGKDRVTRYKNQIKQDVFVATVLSLILAVKWGNAVCVLAPNAPRLPGMDWDALTEHILNPRNIYPISWPWFAAIMTIPVFVLMFSFSENRRKMNTMWKDAHGSGGFEKNLAGFYREFVYDPAIIGGDVIRIEEGKKVSAKLDFVTYDTKINKARYLAHRLNPLTANKLITKKDQAACFLNSQICSNTIYMSMNPRLTQRNLSAMVIGASGAGKSRFIIKPNLLQANSSFVCTDPSGENVLATGKFLESQGYIIKVFNLKNMDRSNRYNPFEYIRGAEDIPSLVNCLKNNIDSAGTGKKKDSGSNKFWDDSTVALLCACVGYLYEAFTDENEYIQDENGNPEPILDAEGNPKVMHDVNGLPILDENGEHIIQYRPNPYWKGKRNFKNVMNLIRMSHVDESDPAAVDDMDQLFADWEMSHPKSFAVNQYKTFKLASGKTTREILVSTAVLLGNYFDLDACTNLTFRDEMELEELGRRKMAIFIITPENDGTFNWLAACLYTQVFKLLYEQGEQNALRRGNDDVSLDVPVRLLIDEFANIGNIPNLQKILSTARKYRLSLVMVLQSLAQLTEVVSTQDEGQVLTENADTMIFLGGGGEKTTKELSGKLGKETIQTFSYGKSYGKNGSGSDNRQETAHDVLSPDEIARMRNDESIIWIRGLRPFCTKKYVYENHPNYKYTPEGGGSKWEYSLEGYQTVYSDEVIAAAMIYSPSDGRYDLYRDKEVLAMLAREHGLPQIDVSGEVDIDGKPARGPVFIGERYSSTEKKYFLDPNNIARQIKEKVAAGEMRKQMMGMGGKAEEKPSQGGASAPSGNTPIKPPQAQGVDISDRGAGGKTEDEREAIEKRIKDIDKGATVSAEEFFRFEGMGAEGAVQRWSLEADYAPEYEFYGENFPDDGEIEKYYGGGSGAGATHLMAPPKLLDKDEVKEEKPEGYAPDDDEPVFEDEPYTDMDSAKDDLGDVSGVADYEDIMNNEEDGSEWS